MPEKLDTIVIQRVAPEIEGGRYPVKREVGDRLEVSADIFKEGHDVLAAVLKYRTVREANWHEVPMAPTGNDRWSAWIDLTENTRYVYTIAAFVETFETWRQEILKKRETHNSPPPPQAAITLARPESAKTASAPKDAPLPVADLQSELLEGLALVETTAASARGDAQPRLRERVEDWKKAGTQEERIRIALHDELAALVRRHEERAVLTVYPRQLEVVVDRVRARYGAWYEMFPRSQGTVADRSATFKDCESRLSAIQAMGFDVLYLPPIHPIGRTSRKGPNNTLQAGPGDPGSPYAIGNEFGGHDAVEPSLGTLADFDRFVQAAEQHGMEIALDFAINCSPDHPYVAQHPEWFYHRPDGTIKYAENPPKKYEDIYPLNFYCENWRNLWEEMRRIIRFWIGHGVNIFRVDNPHTKPVAFWEWLIREIQRDHPEVIFLSEAFTRPKMMQALAKTGFSQSYTYFTWRNFKQELTDYLLELTRSEMKEYFRANFFTNTPDILPEILQHGGRPAFKFRLVLAATLSPSYGIYSGYELCENQAVPGTEEYLNSEKYEYKVWDWDRLGSISDYVTRLNLIRRENPSLHENENLAFYESGNDQVIFYGKTTLDRRNTILVAVNLNPFQAQTATLHVPLQDLGIVVEDTYQLHELMTDHRDLAKGPTYSIRLDPQGEPAAIFAVRRWMHREQDFDYFM